MTNTAVIDAALSRLHTPQRRLQPGEIEYWYYSPDLEDVLICILEYAHEGESQSQDGTPLPGTGPYAILGEAWHRGGDIADVLSASVVKAIETAAVIEQGEA